MNELSEYVWHLASDNEPPVTKEGTQIIVEKRTPKQTFMRQNKLIYNTVEIQYCASKWMECMNKILWFWQKSKWEF